MSKLEALLRLSTIQAELRQLAGDLDADSAKVVERSASMLNLVKSTTVTCAASEPATNVVLLDDFR